MSGEPTQKKAMRETGKGNAEVLKCLVLLPHSYVGRGPAESCVKILEALPACGIETTLYVLRARKPVARSIKVVEGAGPLLKRLPFRYMQRPGKRALFRIFARAIDNAAAGTIVWFWPDSPSGLVRRARDRGLITVREMINSPVAHAKPILDAAYAAIGLAAGHGITDVAVGQEIEELGLYDYLFASNPEVERALGELGIPHERILSTSFGWDQARFDTPATAQLRSDRPFRACFVGLMNVRKGVPVLLEAWRQADLDGELILAGSIEECLRPMVRHAIGKNGVTHVGHVDDVSGLYRKCDVFVFPTLEEGGPQVTYEAASCGLPVVTTPMGAARLVVDRQTGLIVEGGSVHALVQALKSIAADEKLRRSCGDAAANAALRFKYGTVGIERANLLRGLSTKIVRID